MPTPDMSGHVADLLPAYLNGTASPADIDAIERHLGVCQSCHREYQEWLAIAQVTGGDLENAPQPSPTVLEGIWARIQGPEHLIPGTPAPAISFGAHYLWQLLLGQIPLVHRGIWLAAPVTIVIGLVVGLLASSPDRSAIPLALIAPFLAAVSLALIYGPENAPSIELALSTPTAPRLVIIARMAIVFAYDLAVSLLATAVLVAVVGGTGLWPLISMWIGPMLFLSAFALAMSVRFGVQTAILASLILWTVRVFALSEAQLRPESVSESVEMINNFWGSSPLLVAMFICMLFVTLVSIPGRAKFA